MINENERMHISIHAFKKVLFTSEFVYNNPSKKVLQFILLNSEEKNGPVISRYFPKKIKKNSLYKKLFILQVSQKQPVLQKDTKRKTDVSFFLPAKARKLDVLAYEF